MIRACYQVSACKSGRAVACDQGVTWDPLFLRCCPRYTPRMEGAMSDLLKRLRPRERRGSKPRCHFLTHGTRDEVAARLTSMVAPFATVSVALFHSSDRTSSR
jgi:hypothetical protein